MNITLKVTCPDDALFQPWDINASGDERFPIVQGPHPCDGDKIMGFENEPQACELFIGSEGWEEDAIGMSPVFVAKGGGMYSLPGYKVTKVVIHEGEK